MPTYEYRCENCKELLEAFQKMSDAALTKCPKCGHEALKRIVSGGAGVLYKGEGWYVTDYSHKSSGGKEPAVSPDRSKNGESKPKGENSGQPNAAASASTETADSGKSEQGNSQSAEPKSGSKKQESAPKPNPTKSSDPEK